MNGREDKKINDLFYMCSLIEYISRKTKNNKSTIIEVLGYENIKRIYELADVYHCENMESVAEEFIGKTGLSRGSYDHVSMSKYAIPTIWDIGKVYKRLIIGVSEELKLNIIDAAARVYTSFITEKLDDYNCSLYYDNPGLILQSFLEGKIL